MMKLLSVFLSFIFLVSQMGCRSYYKVGINRNDPIVEIQKFEQKKKYIILHQGEKAWCLYAIKIENDSLRGKIDDLPSYRYKYLSTRMNRGNRYKKKTETFVLEEVHIYSSEVSFENGVVLIPMSGIQKIEVYDPDRLSTTVSWVVPLVLIVAILVIMANPTPSPVVF